MGSWQEHQLVTLVDGLDEDEFNQLAKLLKEALKEERKGVTPEGHLGFTLSPRQSAMLTEGDLPKLLEKAGVEWGPGWKILDSVGGGRKTIMIKAADLVLLVPKGPPVGLFLNQFMEGCCEIHDEDDFKLDPEMVFTLWEGWLQLKKKTVNLDKMGFIREFEALYPEFVSPKGDWWRGLRIKVRGFNSYPPPKQIRKRQRRR